MGAKKGWGIVVAFFLVFSVRGQDSGPFRKGERICFVGNSITFAGGFFHEIQLYYATRYPGERLEILNIGVPGDRARSVLRRMNDDILVHRPDWCVLKLGMNDVMKDFYTDSASARPDILAQRAAAFETYRRGYDSIVQIFLRHKIRVILQTPTIYDETAAFGGERLRGRNKELHRYAVFVKELGNKYNLPVVDYWTTLDELTRKVQATDSMATLIGADRVHPGPVGNFIMGYRWLRTMGLRGQVSSVRVDAANGGSAVVNGAISDVHTGKDSAAFLLTERSLPMPVSEDVLPALSLVAFQDSLNSEPVRVQHLAAGRYDLLIDGIWAGRWTSEELGRGITLAGNIHTPQYIQAEKVLGLFQEYWQLEEMVRWMEALAIGRLGAAHMHDTVAGNTYWAGVVGQDALREQFLDHRRRAPAARARMAVLMDSIYLINRPVAHRWVVRRVSDDAAYARECSVRDGMAAFFGKARAGKKLIVAFIGGSVTQMEHKYRNQAEAVIRGMFPKNQFEFINAGVSGTGTDLGACRIGEQVLGRRPDLIFIEFAVNGAYTPGLEGMIRQIRQHDPSTDICLLYSIYDKQGAIYTRGDVPENVKGMDSVAAYYGLPAIHMGVEPSLLEAEGRLVFKAPVNRKGDTMVFSDGIHPTEAGGWLYARAIGRGLAKMMKGAPAKTVAHRGPMPGALIADNWSDATMLRPDQVKFSGEWRRIDPNSDENLQKFTRWFPYLMTSETPGASFSFDFRGSCIGIFDVGGPEVGQLDVVVDGKPLKSLNRFNHWCNARYRGQYDLIQLPDGRHHVEFIVSKDMPDKAAILGKGQQADITAHPAKYDRRVIYLGRVLIRGSISML